MLLAITSVDRMIPLGERLGLFYIDPLQLRRSSFQRFVGALGIAVIAGSLAMSGAPSAALLVLGATIALSVVLKNQVRRVTVSLHEHGIAVFRLGITRAARWSDIRGVELYTLNKLPSLKLALTDGKPIFVPTCLQSWSDFVALLADLAGPEHSLTIHARQLLGPPLNRSDNR